MLRRITKIICLIFNKKGEIKHLLRTSPNSVKTSKLLQVEKLNTEVSKRSHYQEKKSKEKIVAVKRTQELERQVKHTNQASFLSAFSISSQSGGLC